MIYSTNATSLPAVFRDNQQYEINSRHAAPVFQYNYAVRFNQTIFLIDKKIGQFIRLFFEETGAENITLTGMGSAALLELKPTRCLTSKIFESVLEFYRRGGIANQVEGDILNISQDYHFSLLHFYLNHKVQSSNEELFAEGSFLSPFDKLEIAAMQQEIGIFFQLLRQYFHQPSLKIKGLQSEPALKEQSIEPMDAEEGMEKEDAEADLAKSFSMIEKDLRSQRELAKLLAHFEPQAFEKVVCIVRSHSKLLYEQAIKAYVRAHRYCLDDLIHKAKDDQLKWGLISYVPTLDARLVWFSQLKIEAPVEIIEKAVINPLIALGRLEEALEWASKSKNPQLIKQVGHKCKEKARSSSSSSDSLDEELESFSFEENAWVKCVLRPEDIAKMDFDSITQTPFEFIQTEIKHQVTRFQETASLKELELLGRKFMDAVEELLKRELKHGWTQELLVFALQCYIDEMMGREAEQHAKLMRKKCSAVTSYGEQLHPALMEDLQIIKKFIGIARVELKTLFGSSEMQGLLKKRVDLLSETKVADALIVSTRRLFQKRFSLREDFIVQEVSHFFQPHFFKPNAWHKSNSVQPFMEHLEERIESAKLGQGLSAHEIILVKELFIRKSVEMENYQFNPLGWSKLDPYDIKHVEEGVFHRIKNGLQGILRDNFRKSDLGKLTQQQKEGFKGAPLLREIFLQANHAKFKSRED